MANIIWNLQNLQIQNKTFFLSFMANIFFGIYKIYEFKFNLFYRYYMEITGMYYICRYDKEFILQTLPIIFILL